MIVVGLTGGIGSGKSTIAKMFGKLGIPVYTADEEAKNLMKNSKVLKKKIIGLFGKEAYVNGELNKPYISSVIYNNKDYLKRMNAIVHPEVVRHFEKWVYKQKSPYVIKESATLIENNLSDQCDLIVLVTAPKKLRMKRLLKRDHTTEEKIQAIMDNQMNDEEKMKHSDFIIVNKTLENTELQVNNIHKSILSRL